MRIHPVNLPSGHIGLAQSADGLSFTRTKGSVAGGAVFGPYDSDRTAFDNLHVGIGDVQWDAKQQKWIMYYFGGNDEYGPTPYGMAKGIYMKIGKAESADGLSWTRQPSVLLDRGKLKGVHSWINEEWMFASSSVVLSVTPNQAQKVILMPSSSVGPKL